MTRKIGYQPKRRNLYNRRRKSIILLSAEGKNRTETQYFRKVPSPSHVIRFAPGNYTDPVNMVRALKREYDELELDPQLGDEAFCLVDSDVDPKKDKQLKKADAAAGDNIKIVVSSPCFEVWYLCHFLLSTKQFGSNEEVLTALKKYIPEYRKEMTGIWNIIGDKTEVAIHNAKKLEQHCIKKGLKPHTVAFAPATEVYKVIEALN